MRPSPALFQEPVPEPPPKEAWQFREELKRPEAFRFLWDPALAPPPGSLDLRAGLRLEVRFADPQRRLQTAVADLDRCLEASGLRRDGGLPVILEHEPRLEGERFRLAVEPDAVRIAGGTTEAFRRACYALVDRLLGAPGPFLPLGCREEEPWLRHRIARCFFGPIKRPPFNHDELLDEIDYYPDAYLGRLAREGVNGLWLTFAFRDVCRTSLTEPDPQAERRLAKLRRTVDKCLRYGIRTWAFCIEPAAFLPGDPLLERHPALGGAAVGGRTCFCPSSELAQRYLYESARWLFQEAPGLGGLMTISHGERPTTCLSSVGCTQDDPVRCPRCGSIPKWRILEQSLGALRDGLRAADPGAELISWLYMPTPLRRAEWVFEVPEHVPEGVILQYNFESNILKHQLGKPRIGGDYWLSEPGPCEDFARIAAQARRSGTPLSAKIQVGCSHEVATIPFVPIPGLLHRKYAAMRAMGCAHAMQCWYFGNYPGVMNRAAGALARETFERPEEAFLRELAAPDWGDAAPVVVEAWQALAEGYRHFPMTNVFQYYGPAQDGVVWPLHLKPALKPLAPSWKPGYPPSGDTIGECLEQFDLAEALQLCETLQGHWQRGCDRFQTLAPRFAGNPERRRDLGLVEALNLQFGSCRNILRFYYLRWLLMHGRTAPAALEELRALVEAEIRGSERLCALAREDSRLGFHSEAESHKYEPARLLWRVRQLHWLLEHEFPEVSQGLASGAPFPALAPGRRTYRCGGGWVGAQHFRWRLDEECEDLLFRAECPPPSPGAPEPLLILYLIDRAGVQYPRRLLCSPSNLHDNKAWAEVRAAGEAGGSWSATFRVPALSWDRDAARRPGYFGFVYTGARADGEGQVEEAWPAIPAPIPHRLRLGSFNPEHLAVLQTVAGEA